MGWGKAKQEGGWAFALRCVCSNPELSPAAWEAGRQPSWGGGWKSRQQAHNRATPEGRSAVWPRKDSGQPDLHTADPFSYLKRRNTEYKL